MTATAIFARMQAILGSNHPMQSLSELFTLVAQCCDADDYRELGRFCAEKGACYDSMRPMGAAYWFSIPFRLGLPSSSIIAANLILTLISIALSTIASQKLVQKILPCTHNTLNYLLLFTASSVIHAVFVYPTLQVTLSDIPASLFALIPLWLFLIVPDKNFPRFCVLGLAGISLGFAAWTRAFFLYPLLGTLIFWFIYWLADNKHKRVDLILLIALLPLCIQVHATWRNTGAVSYLDKGITEGFTALHMTDTAIGYDTTLLPGSFRWHSSCNQYQGLIPSIQTADLYSLGCLLGGKIYFYLGSYSPLTFHYETRDDSLFVNKPLPDFYISPSSSWHAINMHIEKNTHVASSDAQTMDRLWKPDNKTDGEIYQSVRLEEGATYAFSVTLWRQTTDHTTITLAIREHDSRHIKTSRWFIPMNDRPTTLEAYIAKTGMYDIVIQYPYYKPGSIFEEGPLIITEEMGFNQKPFYASNPQLGKIAHIENKSPEKIRIWSPLLFGLNCAALLGALIFFFRIRKYLTPLIWTSVFFIALSCAQALLIVPEQRYVITPMIYIWVFFSTGIICISSKIFNCIKI